MNKLWIAQYSGPSGNRETLVLFDHSPTLAEIEKQLVGGLSLDSLTQLEFVTGSINRFPMGRPFEVRLP